MYNRKIEDVESLLKTSIKSGLTETDAKDRLLSDGPNALKGKKKTSLFVKFLSQFKDFLVLILMAAAIISIIADPSEWVDSLIIFGVVILNAILGVVQEARAEKSLDALKKLSTPTCKVLRDGKQIIINSEELVKGDIIFVEAGDFVPADARLVESSSLKIDEAALTGESVPVDKKADIIDKNDVALGDKKNMLFSSTYVTYGRGCAIVVSTGMNTEIGKIADMLDSEENKDTPLQNKLSQIGKIMGIMCLIICAVVFVFQILAGFRLGNITGWNSTLAVASLESFKTAVALAVAAIPEGLAAIVTIVLSIGVKKMVDRNAIVKKLPAVETLGCTGVVCSDKTGTLTQNKMTVIEYYENGKTITLKDAKNKSVLLSYAALCSDAKVEVVDGKEVRIGDPTETALVDAQVINGSLKTNKIKRIKEIPFDSDRKLMSVVVEIDNKYLCITKGAPDVIFSLCNDEKNSALKKNQDLASKAFRVLGVGIKEVDKDIQLEDLEKDLNFVGLIGMIDPEREEVKASIAMAKKAGIKTIMITGDHVVTARAIARNLGIFNEGDIALPSDELHAMSDEELMEKLEKISVYARVAPSDKVRIVKAWQAKGKVVAMTGDGVNDSPALKAAEIGCAMGITGTDVSKEAADMILVDDNFSTIINAVEEGRNIYANIKRCVKYLLSSNIGEIVTIFCVTLLEIILNKNFGTPLLAIHLLWINLITDTLPAFALGMEEAGSELMDESPRPKDESFFANKLGLHIALEGLLIGLLTIAGYLIGFYDIFKLTDGASEVCQQLGHTMAFVVLSLTELFHSFNVKSEESIFSKKTFNNKFLIGSFLTGLALLFFVLYVPGVNTVFKLKVLSWQYILTAIGISFVVVIVMELTKLILKVKKQSK